MTLVNDFKCNIFVVHIHFFLKDSDENKSFCVILGQHFLLPMT